MQESQQLPEIRAEPWDIYSNPHDKIYIMPKKFTTEDSFFTRNSGLGQEGYNLSESEKTMIEEMFKIPGLTYLNLVENNLIVGIGKAFWYGEIEPQISEVFTKLNIGSLVPSDLLPLGEIEEVVADLYSDMRNKAALFHVRKEISCSRDSEICKKGEWEYDFETHKRIGEVGSRLVLRLFKENEKIEKIKISVYKLVIITKEKIPLQGIREFRQDVEKIIEEELGIKQS
jgi:hypothetical protein